MGNCARLKWNRQKLGLSQKQFGEKVGLCKATISKLEVDEGYWACIRRDTEDKLCALFEAEGLWQIERTAVDETEDENKEREVDNRDVEEIKAEIKQEVVIHKNDNSLTVKDQKTLTLIEFAYEGLFEAETHEDFVANLNLIKRIIDKY